MADDIRLHEEYHYFLSDGLESDCLNLFCKVVNGNQYELVPI